jgi:hypothetical protein
MKHSFSIIKLLVALTLIVGLFSCSNNGAKHHAKKHGLVSHGCRGLKAMPHRR